MERPFRFCGVYNRGVPRPSLPTAELLTALSETPGRLAELTAGLSASQLRSAPAPGEWSATEVLAHLRSCADVWGRAIATILREDKPTIRAVNPRTWIEGTNYRDLEFQPSLLAFTRQRSTLMKLLRPLDARLWSRSAIITGVGAPLRWTVDFYAQRMAHHEGVHLKQIGQMAAALRGKR